MNRCGALVIGVYFGLAVAMAGRASEFAATRIGASDPRFLYEGRIDTRDPEGPVLIWQGSRVSIDFEGPVLGLDFTRAEGQNFFDVHVDGQVWVAAVPPAGPTHVPFGLPLSPGRHHLSLHKRQEASAGTVQFLGIDLAPGSQAWRPAPPAYALKMEFYGDSITAGACDEDGPSDQWENRRTHNGELSYAALTGQAFNAEWRNISISGIGVVTGWTKHLAGQTWDKLYPRADSPLADLSLWTPDLVCVNLGDNDADYPKAHALPFPDGFAARYTELIHGLRRAYPRAEIVMLMGGMFSGSQSAPLQAAWGQAVAQLEATDPHLHHFSFRYWSNNHPRVAEHRILSDELTFWLRHQDFMRPYIPNAH